MVELYIFGPSKRFWGVDDHLLIYNIVLMNDETIGWQLITCLSITMFYWMMRQSVDNCYMSPCIWSGGGYTFLLGSLPALHYIFHSFIRMISWYCGVVSLEPELFIYFILVIMIILSCISGENNYSISLSLGNTRSRSPWHVFQSGTALLARQEWMKF